MDARSKSLAAIGCFPITDGIHAVISYRETGFFLFSTDHSQSFVILIGAHMSSVVGIQPKVFDSIIQYIADVMHDLSIVQKAAKMFFHHESMLQDIAFFVNVFTIRPLKDSFVLANATWMIWAIHL